MCCRCDDSYIVLVHIQCQASIYSLSFLSRAFMAGAASQAGDADSSRYLVSPLVCRGRWMSTVVFYCWCHSDSASGLLYFTFLSHLFPLPCGAGSTVPREGFRLKCYVFFLVCCGCDTSLYSDGPHAVSNFHIYTFVLSRAFMADAASQAGDADSSRSPGFTSGLQGSVNVHRGVLLLVP